MIARMEKGQTKEVDDDPPSEVVYNFVFDLQPDQYCFEGNLEETAERQGRVLIDLSEYCIAILSTGL